MGLFDAFRKSPKERRVEGAQKRAMKEDLEIYSGMRVEVTSGDGRVFLVARLLELRGDRAQLEPGADGSLMTRSDEPTKVTIRGYSSIEGRAVSMEGIIRVSTGKLWQVENLALVDRAENRANVRVTADIPGSFTLVGRRNGAVLYGGDSTNRRKGGRTRGIHGGDNVLCQYASRTGCE